MGWRAAALQVAIWFAVLATVVSLAALPRDAVGSPTANATEPAIVELATVASGDPLQPAQLVRATSTSDEVLYLNPPEPVITTTTVAPPTTAARPPSSDPCAPTRPLIAPALVRAGPKDRARVAITIDDTFGASGARNVAAVLDVAKARNVKLTFFPTGGALDDHEKAGLAGVWQRVIAEGHEVGNHTYSHWNLLKLGEKDIQDELDSMQGRFDQIVGFHYEMHYMRPPGGNGGFPTTRADPNGDRVRCVVQRLGYTMAMWTVDSNGTQGFSDYLNRLLTPGVVGNGTIILLHFTTFNVNNVAALIDGLRKRGLEPVTLSELLS